MFLSLLSELVWTVWKLTREISLQLALKRFLLSSQIKAFRRALSASFCACGSVVLLHAARVFDYFVAIEIAFMDN